jgi:hypothetical protein
LESSVRHLEQTLARCGGTRSVIEPGATPFTGQPPLTTVDLRAGDVEKTAISMLIAAIEGTRGTDRQIVSTDNQTLSEGGNAAIWEPTLNDWTPVGPLPGILGAREAV